MKVAVSGFVLLGSIVVAIYAFTVALRTKRQHSKALLPLPFVPAPFALVRAEQGMVLIGIAGNPMIPIYSVIGAFDSEHEAMLAFNAAQDERAQGAH